ncbi:unnamed protein product [Brugia timori]|uniref:HIG1 domain-containing protein n=1 Tax=Brugia timori TaxID=42155 RepID=A0A0R3QTB5_9BILA|nr:unnamed protein product [Brugia timori]
MWKLTEIILTQISHFAFITIFNNDDMPFLFHRLSDDTAVAKRMYEKFMKNPAIPVFACVALQMAFSIARKRFVKSMSQAEFNRSIALVPFTAFIGTAAWFHGTSIRDQQYIPHEE